MTTPENYYWYLLVLHQQESCIQEAVQAVLDGLVWNTCAWSFSEMSSVTASFVSIHQAHHVATSINASQKDVKKHFFTSLSISKESLPSNTEKTSTSVSRHFLGFVNDNMIKEF